MSKLKKCVICGEYIQTEEEVIPYKNRYAHKRCFDVTVKVLQEEKTKQIKDKVTQQKTEKKGIKNSKKPLAELKDRLSEEEYKEKQKYYQYLRENLEETGEIWEIKEVEETQVTKATKATLSSSIPPKFYILSEDYIKRYGFTWESMLKTLTYLHDVIKKDFGDGVVGLIPYYHAEAQKYYKNIEETIKENDKIDLNKLYLHKKTVFVSPNKTSVPQINITEIE